MKRTAQNQQQSVAFITAVKKPHAVKYLSEYVRAVNQVLSNRHILTAIITCSFVWLANLSLGAVLAQAQESPPGGYGISVAEAPTARPSISNSEASRLVLSMVDRSELDASAFTNSAIQPANQKPIHQHSAEKPILRSNPRGSEYESLAALASAPSSSLLNAVEGIGSSDAVPPVSTKKTLVYQLGAVNFVINGLPNSFSVSPTGTGAAVVR